MPTPPLLPTRPPMSPAATTDFDIPRLIWEKYFESVGCSTLYRRSEIAVNIYSHVDAH
jgi:hypothetical protein